MSSVVDRDPAPSGRGPGRDAPGADGRRTGLLAGLGRRQRLALLVGPGLMVMLADTDAGSVVTAAQSGASWGYRLLVPQLLLIPVLYLVQEATVRLGLVTGKGHGALIRECFGPRWAVLSAGTLFVACLGALVSEFAGIAGVGHLVGIPRGISVGGTCAALVALLLLGRYRLVERVGIAVGLLELLFVPAALLAHPRAGDVVHGLAHPLVLRQDYVVLLAANVGAVIMPWMVFYQQEAVIDKGLSRLGLRDALRVARLDTAVGSVLTQVVMVAVVVATAATVGRAHPGASLTTVGAIADALTPALGRHAAVALFGAGLLGAAVVAALVVALAGGWGVAEVMGWRHSLNDRPQVARRFYLLCGSGVAGGALLVLLAPDLVSLSVDVEVLNACLLPVVLGFLFALERRALPAEQRMRGARRAVTYALAGLVMALGLYIAVSTVTGHG